MNKQEKVLQRSFRYLNRCMVLMYRLGMAPLVNCFPPLFGQIMILTHTGRKSGKKYQSGLNFAQMNGDIYCTAGFGSESDWYRNIIANPQVEVWINNHWHRCSVEEISNTIENIDIMRQVLVCSGFAAYAAGINPRKLSDEALFEITSSYRLLRLRRAEARTGPGGPGDLAWINTLLLMLILPVVFRKRK